MAQVSYGTITITDTTDIDSIKNWYLATSASSGVTKTTTGWTDTIQQMTESKQYLWNYEQILGTGGIEISSTQPVIIGRYGKDGTEGNSITSIDEYYQITNSTSNPGSSGWSKNTLIVPTSTNKYLWNYQVIHYSKTADEGSYSDARIIGVYGDKGERGTSILKVTTQPTTASGTAGGFSYSYRMSLSTVINESSKTEVLKGDIIEYNSNHYQVGYVNSSYVYLGPVTSIKGADSTQYYVFIRYSANSNGSGYVTTPTSSTKYIGVYMGTSSSPPAYDNNGWTWSKYVGTDGVSVTSGRELYWLKTNSTNPSQITWNSSTSQPSQTIYSDTNPNHWTSMVPTYVTDGTYYTCIETTLSDGTKVWSAPVVNQALTNANSKATEALTQVTAIQETVDATEANMAALQSRLKKIWINEVTNGDYVAGTYAASGIENVTFLESNPQTYGYNTLLRHNKLALRYNTIDMTALTTNALTFYIPTQENNNWVQGEKGLEITASGIDLYYGANSKSLQINNNGLIIYRNDPNNTKSIGLDEDSLSFYGSDPQSPDAQLWSNGLTLQKGGITAGVYNKENRGVAHITDAIEEGLINSLTVTFKFTQSGSGEPSLTNVRDFTGVTETYLFKTNRNLLQRQGVQTYPYTYRGITYTLNENDYSVTANGTATGGYSYCKVGASFVVHEDCILTGCPAGGSNSTYELQLADNGRVRRDYGEGVSLTPNDGKPESIYIVIREGQTVENLTFYPMIRLATDLDSTYEYHALRYYRSFDPDNAGNIYYKGTYDFISGTLTITHKIYDVTFASRTSTTVSGKYRFSTPAITGIKKPTSGELPDMYCNRLPVNTSNKVYNAQQGVAIHSSDNKIYIYISELATNTLTEAQAWLEENPIQVVYPLENPEVIQLTGTKIKTYKGINNFWSRQGTISIEWGDFIYLSTDPYGIYTINNEEFSDWKQIIGTNFGVRADGSLYATNANLSGTVTAKSGSIGGFSIGDNELYSQGKTDVTGSSTGTYIGPSGFGISGGSESTTTYFTEQAILIGGLLSWTATDPENLNINKANEIILGTLGSGLILNNLDFLKNANANDGFKIKTLLSGALLEVSNHKDQIQANQNKIDNLTNRFNNYYEPYINSTNSNPYYIEFKRKALNTASSIKITDTTIELSTNNQRPTTIFEGNLMKTTFGEFENLRMKAESYTNNSGYLTWIARASNGHLSLKVVK